MKNEIPDELLLAEKLGIVRLCENCGCRISVFDGKDISQIVDLQRTLDNYIWIHNANGNQRCYDYTTAFYAYPRMESRQDGIEKNDILR